MKDKIAFICQRYGLEVNGGAETHCRHLAERMVQRFDVEVYTTCALDSVTWANSYRPGEENVNGVTVRRFPVIKTRDQDAFVRYSSKIWSKPETTDEEERKWVDMQGPVCPELLRTLKRKQKEYKAVIGITYLYYPTTESLLMGLPNAYLLPTAHDERAIYMGYYRKVFSAAKGFIWNTAIEKDFVERLYPETKGKPGVICGVGVDLPQGELPDGPKELKGADYIVYAGRIDESKGCGEMFDFFRRYKQQHGGELKLVLLGKPTMEIPDARDIINLGFVSEEIKYAVMRDAKALVLFSHFESLSAVVLESMTMGRPVLVSGKCEVLKDHCLRSNAGLYFETYEEFAGALDYLLTHDAQYEAMRENGKKYVRENYQWDVIMEKIYGLIEA